MAELAGYAGRWGGEAKWWIDWGRRKLNLWGARPPNISHLGLTPEPLAAKKARSTGASRGCPRNLFTSMNVRLTFYLSAVSYFLISELSPFILSCLRLSSYGVTSRAFSHATRRHSSDHPDRCHMAASA